MRKYVERCVTNEKSRASARNGEKANAELRDEVKFLHQALLFTEILAAGFFGAFLAVCSSAGWL